MELDMSSKAAPGKAAPAPPKAGHWDDVGWNLDHSHTGIHVYDFICIMLVYSNIYICIHILTYILYDIYIYYMIYIYIWYIYDIYIYDIYIYMICYVWSVWKNGGYPYLVAIWHWIWGFPIWIQPHLHCLLVLAWFVRRVTCWVVLLAENLLWMCLKAD